MGDEKRGPPKPQKSDQDTVQKASDTSDQEARTAKKQARMDKARAARSTSGPVVHTIDNALAGGPALAEEKAKRSQGRKG